MKIFFLNSVLLLFFFSTAIYSAENDVVLNASNKKSTWNLNHQEKKLYGDLLLLAAPLMITSYGVFKWEWLRGGMKFRARDEKWLQRNTYAGGADKISHTYSHYMITMGYYNLYERMGYSPKESNFKSMMGAGITGLVIELGDGLSRYGFSWGDLLADAVGIGLAGLINAYPFLDELIGFQVQWWPGNAPAKHPHQIIRSPIDDYNNQKYVFNLRASGISGLKEHWATRYLNLDVGYYTRGYRTGITNPETDPNLFARNIYVGMSLNLSTLLETKSNVASTIFKYYQTPYNALEIKKFPLH